MCPNAVSSVEVTVQGCPCACHEDIRGNEGIPLSTGVARFQFDGCHPVVFY